MASDRAIWDVSRAIDPAGNISVSKTLQGTRYYILVLDTVVVQVMFIVQVTLYQTKNLTQMLARIRLHHLIGFIRHKKENILRSPPTHYQRLLKDDFPVQD